MNSEEQKAHKIEACLKQAIYTKLLILPQDYFFLISDYKRKAF